VHRLQYPELLDIVEIGVDSALRINPRDLKLMQRWSRARTASANRSRCIDGALRIGAGWRLRFPRQSRRHKRAPAGNLQPRPYMTNLIPQWMLQGSAKVPDEGVYYSIQEVSGKLGIPIQKLRRWDQDGVLKASRSNGGHRRYAKELIDRLAAQSISPDKTSKELATIKKVAGRQAAHHPAPARKRAPLPRPGRNIARSGVDHRSTGPLHLPQQCGARHLRPVAA
jgi:excisionase family DNA binding protein